MDEQLLRIVVSTVVSGWCGYARKGKSDEVETPREKNEDKAF